LTSYQPENFVSPDEDAVTIDINYKGKPISLKVSPFKPNPKVNQAERRFGYLIFQTIFS
jgi:hypothetical protein